MESVDEKNNAYHIARLEIFLLEDYDDHVTVGSVLTVECRTGGTMLPGMTPWWVY